MSELLEYVEDSGGHIDMLLSTWRIDWGHHPWIRGDIVPATFSDTGAGSDDLVVSGVVIIDLKFDMMVASGVELYCQLSRMQSILNHS